MALATPSESVIKSDPSEAVLPKVELAGDINAVTFSSSKKANNLVLGFIPDAVTCISRDLI